MGRIRTWLGGIGLAGISVIQGFGCAGWQAVSGPRPEAVVARRWTDLRVTVEGRVDFEMSRARVSNDSLVGVLGKVRIDDRRADTATAAAILRRFSLPTDRDSTIGVPFSAVVRLERYTDPFGAAPVWILALVGIAAAVAGHSIWFPSN